MQIDRKPNKLLLLLGATWDKALGVAIVGSLLGQCISNANLSSRMDEIASRNTPVQVGSDRQILMGRRISATENRDQFAAEIISSFSWVKRTTPEYQESCKTIAKEQKNIKLFKQCESGIDPGVITPQGKFPSSVYAYQHLIAPESREDVLRWILKYKPPEFDTSKSQGTRSLKVSKIGAWEEFKEGKNGAEMRAPVEIEFSEAHGAVQTRKLRQYYWIYTRDFLRPTANGAKNPYSLAVEASQQRGLYLTRILPYTNTSF
jgi:hypothetical protein